MKSNTLLYFLQVFSTRFYCFFKKSSYVTFMLKEWFKGVIKLFAFFFLLLALWLVYQEIEKIGMTQIWASMRSTPFWVLGVAFTFVLLDYAAYSGYDLLALRYIGKKSLCQPLLKRQWSVFPLQTQRDTLISQAVPSDIFFTPNMDLTKLMF